MLHSTADVAIIDQFNNYHWLYRRSHISKREMRVDLYFQQPVALLASAKAEMAAVANEKLFNDARYAKAREAWCAAMLGLGYENALLHAELL